MLLPQLRTFVEVYRQRSITSAARSLGLTQPAVSQHIAALETAIERPLFERHARGVTPTVAAEGLAASIGDRLDVAEAALAAARARSSEITGAIRLIGQGDFLAEVVTPRLGRLLGLGLRIRLQAGNREDIRIGLTEGHYDLGLCAYPLQDRRLRSVCVHRETVHAVAAPAVAARLMAADDLAVALAAEPVLAYNLERPLVDDWLAANDLARQPVSPVLIGQDLRGLCRLLEQGSCWSALPAYLCAGQIASGELVEIPPPVRLPVNAYHLVWTPSALRQPRVAFARGELLTLLLGDQGDADAHG